MMQLEVNWSWRWDGGVGIYDRTTGGLRISQGAELNSAQPRKNNTNTQYIKTPSS